MRPLAWNVSCGDTDLGGRAVGDHDSDIRSTSTLGTTIAPRFRRTSRVIEPLTKQSGNHAMNLIVLIIILLILFGGGGFYYGGPYVGGGLGTILLIVLIVLLLR